MFDTIDVRMTEVDEKGHYGVEFSTCGVDKKITRWFKNEDSALAVAAFAAAQQGVSHREMLLDWLEARGFPRRQPLESTKIEEVKD